MDRPRARPLFFKLGPYADKYLDEQLAAFRNKDPRANGQRREGFTIHAHWDRDYVLGNAMLYENRYTQLTEDERVRFRRYLAERAYSVLDTDLTATPVNLEVIDQITVAGVMVVLFPDHPDHGRFRDAFLRALRFVDRHYIRTDRAAWGARGGRYTENVACYEPWAYGMRGMAAVALYLHDPEGQRQPNADLGRWLFYRMNVLSPRIEMEGQASRTPPPQGAHAHVDAPLFVAQGYAYSRLMERYDPRLHDAWSWLYWHNAPWTARGDWVYTYKDIPPSPLEAVTAPEWKVRPAGLAEREVLRLRRRVPPRLRHSAGNVGLRCPFAKHLLPLGTEPVGTDLLFRRRPGLELERRKTAATTRQPRSRATST